MEKKFKRTLVTSALPYANGPVHIGHLAGVYVPADIYVRYLRLKGEDMLFTLLVGPDHGSLIGGEAGVFINNVGGEVEVLRHRHGIIFIEILQRGIIRGSESFDQSHRSG